MSNYILTVLEHFGFVLLYVVIVAVLSGPLRRSKVKYFLAAVIAGIVFLGSMILPEKAMLVVMQYTALVSIVFLSVLFSVIAIWGWLTFKGFQPNDSFLKKSGTTLLIAAALSFLIWWIGLMIFDTILGGDPFRGKVVGDTYYFGRGGDEYTRVTPETWWIGFWLQIALHCIPPLFLVSGLILICLPRFREKTWRRREVAKSCQQKK